MNSSMHNGNVSANRKEDFFSFMMDENPARTFSLIFSSVCALVVPIVQYSLVWFDKYGSDHRRTFENMMKLTCAG